MGGAAACPVPSALARKRVEGSETSAIAGTDSRSWRRVISDMLRIMDLHYRREKSMKRWIGPMAVALAAAAMWSVTRSRPAHAFARRTGALAPQTAAAARPADLVLRNGKI